MPISIHRAQMAWPLITPASGALKRVVEGSGGPEVERGPPAGCAASCGAHPAKSATNALECVFTSMALLYMATLKLTLVLDSGARIGSGKAALLESIHETGSISASARSMRMDYKRAWLLVDSLNRAFDTPIVERTTGGAGGGASLTELGQDLLSRYRRLQDAAEQFATDDLAAIEQRALPEAGPKV